MAAPPHSQRATASPASIMPDSETPYMTIHTDIMLFAVARDTLELSGIPASSVFADNHGNLVAKFRMEDVKGIVSPPRTTLVLTGLTIEGEPFEGADTVAVVVPNGK